MDWHYLARAQFNAATSKERVAARKLCDNERGRLALIPGELLAWHEQYWPNKEEIKMAEIDENVPIPDIPEATAAPEKPKRGRKPKAKATGPSQAEQLEAALAFVAPVESELLDNSKFVNLVGNMAVTYNGQLSAGHPIEENLNVAPELYKLRAALKKCGSKLVITETDNLGIVIQGERLRAIIPCIYPSSLGQMQPDIPQLEGDFEILKKAFQIAGMFTDEKGTRVIEASLLLQPNVCTGTNGIAMMQYWHGIATLPPDLVLPKIFCNAVAKTAKRITGLGGAWDAEKGIMSSFTVWFEGGAWLKTQTYYDRWPDIEKILNIPCAPIEVPEGFFEGIEAIDDFLDSAAIFLTPGFVSSTHGNIAGANYSVPNLNANRTLNCDMLKKIAPYTKTIDLTSHERQIMFFGDNLRGTLMGMSS